jgi:tRNA threonylcarbamoyladenosine biosynthesis protein TsaB
VRWSHNGMLVLGIDTCGPSGSVALAQLIGDNLDMLGETPLEGRTYSATLIAAISDLLKANHVSLQEIGSLAVVSGPGSFTGVRVGLSAAKGLAEGADLRIVALSRLEVLAQKKGLLDAALDAQRHEIFLRLGSRELLAGEAELAAQPTPARIAVCDDAASALLANCWPAAELVQVPAPTAADALRLAVARILACDFADPALLDGHYVRRSDAEIFGDPAAARK